MLRLGIPLQKKAQTAQLLALMIQRNNTQIRRPGDPRVRSLHSDEGGEFRSNSLEEFCQWEDIAHTFTDRAQHQSNALVERKIGQLNKSTRAVLLASVPPTYLRPEVYMAMCHTQNTVPSSALQRELKKKKKERLKKMKKDVEEAECGEGVSVPGEQGEVEAQTAAESPEAQVRDKIPWCFTAM